MIYVDDTALVEIARRTDTGRALARRLNENMTQAVLTSVLSEVQLAWALGGDPVGASLLRRVSRYEIDADVRVAAAVIGGRAGTNIGLDTAIHVGTALVVLGDTCTGFATTVPERAAVASRHHLPLLRPSRARTPPACR